MTEQAQQTAGTLDTVKLIAGVAILAAGIAGFYSLPAWPIWSRWLIVLAALTAGGFVALQSMQGRQFWEFVQSSRIELRKVVWRDKDSPQTWQVAVLVFVVVAILTTFFWVLDMLLAWITRMLTGQGA